MGKSIVLTKKVKKADLQTEYLKAINGILDLTNRELELLKLLAEFDQNSLEDEKSVICTENRKKVNDLLGISPDNLSRYIKKFKENGILVKGKVDGEMHVNSSLLPEIIKDRVQITIVLRIDETK